MSRIRSSLRRPGAAVRLIGLSGLGKTRLLQALFDDRVGDDARDTQRVLYTDTADAPEPSPMAMADRLVRNRSPGILVIDNCPPETHRAVAAITSVAESRLSLITVEYDVRDDEPENTAVFRLEAASDDVITRLIGSRYPAIEDSYRRRLAVFAGGNARIALAIAGTVHKRETLGDLSDDQLFHRLLNQSKPEDAGLLQSAQVLALVYSFDGEATADADSELGVLAGLIGRTASSLYGHVAELRNRGLVQRRPASRHRQSVGETGPRCRPD